MDGSYIATKWFCIFYLPIIPLKSCRIKLLNSDIDYAFRGVKFMRNYEIVFITKFQWKQVLQKFLLGWLFWWLGLLAIFLLSYFVCSRR